MSDTDAMRQAGPPRPPNQGVMPPQRPGIMPQQQTRPAAVMPPGSPNIIRNMPPPLRTSDSRNNMTMGPGPPGPPVPRHMGMPQQQMRPTMDSGPMSPSGQVPIPRQFYPQQQMQGNRPQNPYGRPPFPRPPGGAPLVGSPTGQPPPQFGTGARPPFMQQQSPGGQLPSQMPQKQLMMQTPNQQRPPSSMSSYINDDDEDVVLGQAITPVKSVILKHDPMGPSLLEDVQPSFKNTTAIEASTTETKIPTSYYKSPLSNISNNFEKPKNGFKGDNDSGVDESTQEKERNGLGSPNSPVKTPTSSSSKPDKSGISRPPSATPSYKSTQSRSTSRNRLLLKTPEPESVKKVPMNKVQVGNAPSPNLKAVRSKIGSLDNAQYKPGGGHVKIESKKIEIKATPRIEAKNDKYTPRGGDKKILSTKLQWNAKSKIGSLENANHKPGGGDKKIESIKTDFKDKAKPKVASKDNVKHTPGGGDIKENTNKDILTQKIEVKAQSKVGSLDNVKHKPGGGEKKIFDDKDYLKNVEHTVGVTSPSQSPLPSSMTTSTSIGADENLNQQS